MMPIGAFLFMREQTQSGQPTTFGQFFDALIESLGLSGAEAARRLGVAQSQVGRWRRDEGGVSLESLERIHEEFGADLDYMKQLAGLRSRSASIGTVDPRIAALLDAERAEIHEALHDIPDIFWPAILETGRTARRAAAKAARQAQALSRQMGAALSGTDDTSSPSDEGSRRRRGPNQRRFYDVPDPLLADQYVSPVPAGA